MNENQKDRNQEIIPSYRDILHLFSETVLTESDNFYIEFDELVAMGALYVNPEAKLLSVLFFTYGFQIDRLAMGMTLSIITFLPLVFVGVALQRLQRRLQY